MKINIKDPPLLKFPLKVKLSTKTGSIGLFLTIFMRLLLFRRAIKLLNPDVLIGNGVSGTNPYGLCGAFSGFHPFVVLVWGSDILVEARSSLLLRIITKFVLIKADVVIVDSEVKRKAAICLGCSEKKIWKFPWGINLDLFNPNIDGLEIKKKLEWQDKTVVVSTRNHSQIYGVEYLIKSIPDVIKAVPSTRFLILGTGPNTNNLKKTTKLLGISKYVHFTGEIPNKEISKYLMAADIYVSTSFSDGSSNSLLEAMACGLPVVVTNIDGNLEWIREGENGFLVPIKNSKVLSEKILTLINNSKIRELMGNKNVKVAKSKANWKQNLCVLFNIIEKISKN